MIPWDVTLELVCSPRQGNVGKFPSWLKDNATVTMHLSIPIEVNSVQFNSIQFNSIQFNSIE